jgi:murein DD-endopeptidase MepM/ murein hydrolase activator NlpD
MPASTTAEKTTPTSRRTFVRRSALVMTGLVTLSVGFTATGASASTAKNAGAKSSQSAPTMTPLTKLPRFGQSGDAVRAMQTALVAKGFTLVGGIDGVFSQRTRATLRNFQKVVGFKATGRLDRKTAKVLGLLDVQTAAVAPVATPAPAAPVVELAPVVAPAASPVAFVATALPVLGARGEDVRAVQTALIAAGIDVFGGADGIFGNATTSAIAKFQTARNLPATGTITVDTLIELGLMPRPVLPLTIAVFPVQPSCYFTDTWQAPRGTRLHEGVDIIANKGQAVYAVADGVITKTYNSQNSPLSGNGVRLTTADGTYFFYAHLDTVAPGIGLGSVVTAGQVLGTVGATGNTTTPHLHFEVHPQGGAAVNPYPIVKAVDACKNS